MQENRRARLQAVIQEELSSIVPRELKDPRIPSVTFTEVQVTFDGSQATIFVAILGGAAGGHDGTPALSDKAAQMRMKDCLEGLTSASGFLRRHLGRILSVRHIPTLIFKEDRGFENALRVGQLLTQIHTSDELAGIKPSEPEKSEKSPDESEAGQDVTHEVDHEVAHGAGKHHSKKSK